jgi:putative ABC transport system ATP-binding protein
VGSWENPFERIGVEEGKNVRTPIQRVEVLGGYIFIVSTEKGSPEGWIGGKYTVDTTKNPKWVDVELTGPMFAEQATKLYGTMKALDEVCLDIAAGDFLALMGPSGSGKTTLLNLIGGLDQPTAGRLAVAGRRIDELSSGDLAAWRAAHVGFVFQAYNLLPALSAQRNVELPLLLTDLPAAERRRRARIALTLVGLADRAGHRPKELSGGQEQRVAIARAIVSDPTLLVCDEPTGDLDRETADDVLTLLQVLNREHGKTVVMVTHDPKAAERAHATLHLDKGVLAS